MEHFSKLKSQTFDLGVGGDQNKVKIGVDIGRWPNTHVQINADVVLCLLDVQRDSGLQTL